MNCGVCGNSLDQQTRGIPISIESGLVIPNSSQAKWMGMPCCNRCFILHEKWSLEFMYLGYLITDGRSELTTDELLVWGVQDMLDD